MQLVETAVDFPPPLDDAVLPTRKDGADGFAHACLIPTPSSPIAAAVDLEDLQHGRDGNRARVARDIPEPPPIRSTSIVIREEEEEAFLTAGCAGAGAAGAGAAAARPTARWL